MEEDYRTSSNFHRRINIVERIIPSSPLTIQCRYDLVVCEFDITMENISIGLSQGLMMYRLIRNVRVSRTRIGYSMYTYKQHRGISAGLLARKLDIGIDKAKHTLQSITQDNVRSSLDPLKRWYRTYFLPQRLHRINCRFYTVTLFTKDKSIVGNKCAQIFIYGDFFK